MVNEASPETGHIQDHLTQVGLAVSAGDRLRFGAFFPGEAREVRPDSAGAASFEIFGAANASVDLQLNYPRSLADGQNALPITFGPKSAALNVTNERSSSVPFDPSEPTAARLGPNGYLFVFVGGTVPPATEEPGNYFADISLEVAYSG